jgi:hypothetical protein
VAGTIYALLAVTGSALPDAFQREAAVVVGAAAAFAGIWYVLPTTWLPSSRWQVARNPIVYRPGIGAAVFGAFLGTGLLTRITTPFVWVGLLAVIDAGRGTAGLAYGAAFALGRTLQLVVSYRWPAATASALVDRMAKTEEKLYRTIGLSLALATVAWAATLSS